MCSTLTWGGLLKWRRLLRTALFLTVASVTSCAIYFLAPKSSESLLADAYHEQRTMELRIEGATHAVLVGQRGRPTSSIDRPLPLLEAEARIGRSLKKKPGSPILLSQRGRANLLGWSYEAAITDLHQALDSESKSVAALSDLASAYFERAEVEHAFSDYGTAFELQSRALQLQPDDGVVLFNRALTAGRLFLFKQSIEDWERYLRLESTGDWANEARGRLEDVRRTVEARDRRTKTPLLSADEFAREVDPENPETWNRVDPRIEEYLTTATTDWLPRAFLERSRPLLSTPTGLALHTLAIILRKRHGDGWLTDMLSVRRTPQLADAAAALSRAFTADNVDEDFAVGLKESVRAAQLFTAAGSVAGTLRAAFEEIYALHFSDNARRCLDKIATLSPRISGHAYSWMRIQLKLEEKTCLNFENVLGRSRDLASDALRDADLARYDALTLRAVGFLAYAERFKGRRATVWSLCGRGLQAFWANSTYSTSGYNLYTFLDDVAGQEEMWDYTVAVDHQALDIVSSSANPLTRASLLIHLASAETKTGDTEGAHQSLSLASKLLNEAPQTNVTENYRLGIAIDLAKLEVKSNAPEESLSRLAGLSTQAASISNEILLAEYYKVVGAAQAQVGRLEDAETALQSAISIFEDQRASLGTDIDRITWSRESAESYENLVETELRRQNSGAALAVWEMFRDAALRPVVPSLKGHTVFPLSPHRGAQLARGAIAEETALLNRVLPSFANRTLVIYALLSHGVGIWTYNGHGLRYHWVDKDPTYIRMLARRFGEMCATPSSSVFAIRTLARQLYGILIGPIAEELRQNEVVTVEADEALGAIPFQVLLDQQDHYLIEQHPIVYSIGLRYLAMLPAEDSEFGAMTRILAVANAMGKQNEALRPLADAIQEAESVAQHFPRAQVLAGNAASIDSVEAKLSKADIFHFAGHTGSIGSRTGLLLSGEVGDQTMAVLDATALNRLSFTGMRMAVLSACSTEREPGESALSESLVHAFLRNKVPHVVATRWNVDSSSSKTIMKLFYDGLVAEESVPRALAWAEIQMSRTAAHPYYWAAFDAFGN